LGSLIDEALLEFTSLQQGDRASNPTGGSSPLSIGSFENVQDWTKDLGDLGLDEPRQGQPSDHQYEVGNLAALEEQETRSRRKSSDQITSTMPPPRPIADPAHAGASLAQKKSGGKGSMIAIIVLLIVVVLLLGVYWAKFKS
jgi:hypothetical protein